MKQAQITTAAMLLAFIAGLTGCYSSKSHQIASDKFHWPKAKRAAISLSFDDARLSQADRGLPILDTYGVKATFYVSLRSLQQRLPTWKKAVANGHEIGNHTLTHPCSGNFGFSRDRALENYTLKKMKRELNESNAAIEHLLGVTPGTFAYPCGQKFVGRGPTVKSYIPLVARKFIAGRGAYNEIANDPAFCDMAQVTGLELDGLDFKQVKKLIDVAAADGRWLIFFAHEIGEPARQTVTPSTLEALCRYAQDPDNELWIDTVQAIGEYILKQRADTNK